MSLSDPFGRAVTYLRLSVTDRCDLRCVYCMAERQVFLPKAQVLTLEELERLASIFIGLGVRRLRLTGGEPLVRRGFMDLVRALSRHMRDGALDELTLTTNGTLLDEYAETLAGVGVKRINVSLDSLDAETFARVTRGGDLERVLGGIEAARAAGLHVKINTVALQHDNAHALADMISWAHGLGMTISLIETMPMGEIEADRMDQFVSLKDVRADLDSFWTLTPLAMRTGGPARYVRVEETGGVLGFITPLTHNFCESCNRVRVSCTGVLYPCLGQEMAIDLRAPLRMSADDDAVIAAILDGLNKKPKGHDFEIARRGAAPSVGRPMSATGG